MEVTRKKPTLEGKIVSWSQARKWFANCNSELTEIIDQLDPPPEYQLVRVKYPFGAKLMSGGVVEKASIPSAISGKIIPLLLSINKASEIYLETSNHRAMPFLLAAPGQLFSIPSFSEGLPSFTPTLPWHISAGARSLFMLPKITDTNAHKRLRAEFRVPYQPPRNLWEHHQLFTSIAAQDRSQHWYSDVFWFTECWFKHKRKDAAWLAFQRYLYQRYWQQTAYLRQQKVFSLFWSLPMSIISNHPSRLRPYIVDIVNHILSIACGFIPGFQAAGSSDAVAPIKLIMDAYIDVYGLKEYLPIVMRPTFMATERQPIYSYYSLALPTLFEGYPPMKTAPNIIHELKDVKYLQELLYESLIQGYLRGNEYLREVSYKYFHTYSDNRNSIFLAQEMPQEDPSLIQIASFYPNRIFPAASPFVRGCVRVKPPV